MPFWLAFGIVEEFDGGGRGISVCVLQNGFGSFDDAAQSLVDAEVPVVSSHVTEANAYVVEADTIDQASILLRAVLEKHESSSHVQLVQQDIRTRRRADEPVEIEALNRLHGELCITHQLTELALACVKGDERRERLERHKGALENLGYAVRMMRGDKPTSATEGSGRERLGYTNGQVVGAESATFAGALAALAGELSIARHQAALAKEIVPTHEKRLDDLGNELDRFMTSVTEMQHQAGRSSRNGEAAGAGNNSGSSKVRKFQGALARFEADNKGQSGAKPSAC